MALQDYGSCSYTMHHHNQLGTYIIRTTRKLAPQFLEAVKVFRSEGQYLHASPVAEERSVTIVLL
jgi:hypothetical protein